MAKKTNTVNSKIALLVANAKASAVSRELALLENPKYQNIVLGKEDSKILDKMIKVVEEATGKAVFGGYTYSENTEKLVALISGLQFAKAEARDIIPSGYYALLPRTIRDMTIEAYGRLPYYAEATTLSLADGSTRVVNQEVVDMAMLGTPTDVETLSLALEIARSALGLVGTDEVTQRQADTAFTRATAKAQLNATLAQLESQLRA